MYSGPVITAATWFTWYEHEEDKLNYLVRTVQKVQGTGIVYVRSRKLTREISDLLRKNKISADHYHAGLNSKVRSQRQEAWKNGQCPGYCLNQRFWGWVSDKADVRFVIHLEAPDSVEAYFQEAGRAGRDGKPAWAVLLYTNSDKLRLEKNVEKSFPEPEVIKRIYEALCNFYQIAVGFGKDQSFEFSMATFASSFSFQINRGFQQPEDPSARRLPRT